MEQQNKAAMPSNRQGIIFGFVTGLAMVGYSLLMKLIHAPEDSRMNFIAHIFYLLGVVWFIYTYSKENVQSSSFGGLFKAGFRMVTIVTIVLLISTLLTIYLDPTLKERTMAYNRELLVKANVKPEQIEIEMKAASEKFTMFKVMIALYTAVFEGVIFSLIGAALFKKNKV